MEVSPAVDTMRPETHIKLLGLEVDLVEKIFRFDPAWVEKVSGDPDLNKLTRRSFFALLGALIWTDTVKGTNLWMRAESLAALSTVRAQRRRRRRQTRSRTGTRRTRCRSTRGETSSSGGEGQRVASAP